MLIACCYHVHLFREYNHSALLEQTQLFISSRLYSVPGCMTSYRQEFHPKFTQSIEFRNRCTHAIHCEIWSIPHTPRSVILAKEAV